MYVRIRVTLVIFALSVLASSEVLGEIIVQAESTAVTSGSSPVSSFFDVYFGVTPGDTSNTLAGFQIKLELNPNNGSITFGTPQNTFVTPSRLAALPSNAMFDTTGSDSHTIMASVFVNAGSEQTIDNGDGLIRVPFTVAPGTIGTFNVIIDQPNTLLSDGSGSAISYQAVNGTIVVSPVPEPSSILLVALAVSSLAAFRSRQWLSGRLWQRC